MTSSRILIRHDLGFGWIQDKLWSYNWRSISRPWLSVLTQWGRVTHICVSRPTIVGSENGLSPGQRQAITWTTAGISLIGPLGTNFSEIVIECRLDDGGHFVSSSMCQVFHKLNDHKNMDIALSSHNLLDLVFGTGPMLYILNVLILL